MLGNQHFSFCTVYSHGNPRRAGSVEQELSHILDQEISPPTFRTQSAPAAVIPDVGSLPQVCDHFWQIVSENVAYKRAKQSQQAPKQAVETVLWDIFFDNYTEADGKLKRVVYRFIKTVLTDMVGKETLLEVFAQSFERQNASIMFTDAIAARALCSSLFIWSVASVVSTHMDRIVDEWSLTSKDGKFSQPRFVCTWPLSPSLSSSGDEADCKEA